MNDTKKCFTDDLIKASRKRTHGNAKRSEFHGNAKWPDATRYK